MDFFVMPDIPELSVHTRIILIAVLLLMLALYLQLAGQLDRLETIQNWDRSRFLSLLKHHLKLSEEQLFSSMATTSTPQDTEAKDALS